MKILNKTVKEIKGDGGVGMADLFEKIEGVTKNMVGKGKDLTEIFQIEREIVAQEKEIEKLKILMGDYVLSKSLYEEEEQLVAYVKEINMRKESVQIKQENILKLKNLMKCPACNYELPKDAKFCKNCGVMIEVQNSIVGNKQICGNCGSQITEGAKFCSKCGNRI